MRYWSELVFIIFLELSHFSLAARSPSPGSPSYRTIHSKFGGNSLRLKSWLAGQTGLCPGAAAHHAGWADIGDRHLFFWYHEARRAPKTAPLLLWLQGEPGLSSLQTMLYENGPCLAKGNKGTEDNPFSWTEAFNIVYLDHLVDVGFSYSGQAEDGVNPFNAEEFSTNVISYLKIFYESFPELAANDLHIGGESHAGQSISALASMVIDYNEFLLSAPLGNSALLQEVIPLRSIMLGNPLIDPAVQLPALYDASCFEYRGMPPRVGQENCDQALKNLDPCEVALHICSSHPEESLLRATATDSCVGEILQPLLKANTSTHDRRRINCGNMTDCYPDIAQLDAFLNSPEVLVGLLEVAASTDGGKTSWERVSDVVAKRYNQSGDGVISSTEKLGYVLQHGRKSDGSRLNISRSVDVLVYTGVADPTFDPDGAFEALRQVKWHGRAPFRAVPWQELPWKTSNGQRSGRVKKFSNLCMVELEQAGHMVSYDQPESTLRMIELWLQHLGGDSPSTWEKIPLFSGSGQKALGVEEL